MRNLLALLLLTPCALLAQVPDYVPTDGLVAWYPLDSTALDESGNGHHLTLDGPTWDEGTEDADDQALLFDGQDDVALIPHHPDFNSPEMSLSLWVNVHTDQLLDSPGLSDFMGMINKTDLEAPVLDRRQFDVQLYAESAGTSPFNLGWLASTGQSVNELDVELVTAPTNLPAFEWNHIVVTASDSTLSIHINGEHIATNDLLHPRVLNTADIQIGRDYLGLAQRHFNGRMDDIAFYNRVLTADEVTDLYQSSSSEETCFDFSEVPAEIHLDNGPVTLQLGPGESSPQAGSNGAVTISEPGLFVLERSVGDAHLSLVQDSSWVDFGDILNDLTPPVSFSFDVRLTGNGGPILATDNGNPSYYNGYWMSLNNSELACAFGDGGWHGGGERRTGRLYSDFAQNEWYHITCVVNGANDFAFYLDGVEQTTSYNDAGFGGPVNFTSDPMKLGHHNAASPGTGAHYDQCFTGDLNNVTVWHRALNGAEAAALQEGGLPEDLTALVAYWDFNGTTSGVVLDGSGLGHDGQLMGNATISTTPECTTTDTIVVHGPMDPEDRIGGALQMDGVDDYASFILPAGWGESSFTVSLSCSLEDFGSTDVDGYHYLFGHALTSQNGDIGFKAQTVPDAQQVIWAFSDDDGDGALSLLSDQVLEPDTWYALTLVFDRDSALATVFVDGVPTGEATIPATMGNLESGQPVGLGAFVYPPGDNLQHFHQGAFADVHFFPAALTEAEIHSLIQECTPPDIPGAAHWGVNGDQYVNLTTQEPATVVGGTIVNDTLPCPTPGTPTLGCTNPNACNYDPTATQDDGSCLETVSLDLGPDILTCDDAVTLDASGTFNHYNWSSGGEEASTTVYSTGTYIVTAGFGTTNGTALDFSHELGTAFISGTNNNCVQDYLSGSMDLGVAQNAISAVTVEFETSNGTICGGSCASWGIKLELRNDAGQTVDSLVLGEVFGASCIQTGTTGTFTFTPDFTSDQTDAPVLFLQSVDFASASARITHIEFGNPTCTVTDSIQVLMTDCATLDALCGEGSIWDNEAQQCTNTLDDGSFPCGTGTVWDPVAEECIVAIPTDTDFDGCVTAGDVLNLLATFGTCPPVPAWPDTPSDTSGTSWSCGDPLPHQGYDYATVQIGGQCWFAENCRFLPSVSPPEMGSETDGEPHAYVYDYSGTDVSLAMQSPQYLLHGALYNFQAATSWDVCPSGWHVPTKDEFRELDIFLGLDPNSGVGWSGMDSGIGDALKSQTGWCCNDQGNNATGFSAIGSGGRWDNDAIGFHDLNNACRWWTQTPSGDLAWHHDVAAGYPGIYWKNDAPKARGHSIRCLKD